jgi:hypothetical protein
MGRSGGKNLELGNGYEWVFCYIKNIENIVNL